MIGQPLRHETTPRDLPSNPDVVICYRRLDGGFTGRLHGDLQRSLGRERLFCDFDMRPGTPWLERLQAVIKSCRVMLVVIGPHWATARLAEPGDTVRIELETALAHQVTIIPVLVDGARMPERGDLPESLARLCDIHAFSVSDAHWETDVARLTTLLRGEIGGALAPITSGWRPRGHWLALTAPIAAALVAALVSARLAQKPIDGSAFTITPRELALERVGYYALERGLFWALVGAGVLVAAALLAGPERRPLNSGIVGFGLGAVGGLLGGAAYQGVKYLANPAVGTLEKLPEDWLLRLPNLALPAALIGWGFGNRHEGPTRLEAAFAGLACGLVAVAIAALAGDNRGLRLMIEAAVVTVPLLLLIPTRDTKPEPRAVSAPRSSLRGSPRR